MVLAIGYYDLPNYLGVPGEDLPHVSHYYTDAHPYYRQRVVVVGGKNSAAEAALELFRGGAHVTLVHRHAALGESIKYWVRPDIDNRIKEGSIQAQVRDDRVRDSSDGCRRAASGYARGDSGRRRVPADRLSSRRRADERAGIQVDPDTLAPALNQETFETNVPNLFLAGGCVAGKATGNIFIENGRFHGEKIIAELAARFDHL